MLCILNRDVIEEKNAAIGVRDLAIVRGYGIFDFFRIANGVPLFIDDHLDRFYRAADKVRLAVPYSRDEFRSRLFDLFNQNNMPICGVRIVLTGGYTANGFDPGEPNLIVTQEEISFPSVDKYEEGIKLITHEYLRDLPDVKTINYMTGVWLRDLIKQKDAYDVIYTHQQNVLELTRSNIYIVDHHDCIVTPSANILHGITRKNLLQTARAETDIKIEERNFSVGELLNAKEAFLTGTTKRVLPITKVDTHLIHGGEVGDITKKMMTLFKKCEEKYISSHLK